MLAAPPPTREFAALSQLVNISSLILLGSSLSLGISALGAGETSGKLENDAIAWCWHLGDGNLCRFLRRILVFIVGDESWVSRSARKTSGLKSNQTGEIAFSHPVH